MFTSKHRIRKYVAAVTMGIAVAGSGAMLSAPVFAAEAAQQTATATQTAIVRADSVAAARQAVETAGGRVVQEMTLTKAVNAEVTAEQLRTLQADPSVQRVYARLRVQHAADTVGKGGVAGGAVYGEQSDDQVW